MSIKKENLHFFNKKGNNLNLYYDSVSGLYRGNYALSEKPVSVAHQSADSFSMGRSNLVFGVDATESAAGGDNVSAVSVVFLITNK